MSVLSKIDVSTKMFRQLKNLRSPSLLGKAQVNYFFKTHEVSYPAVKPLPLPCNIEDIAGAEKSRFSPERFRDVNGSLLAGDVFHSSNDARVGCYDSNGSLSLNCSMQSNVPDPCTDHLMYSHFNMPGGMWRQSEKYIAADHIMTSTFVRHYSTNPDKVEGKQEGYAALSRKEKLKTAVKEYGAVVIVFHVGISLMSLGASYLAVTSGIDFSSLLDKFGASEGALAAGTAAPFVVAYALHKVFAPVRISITLVSVPFIVKYLRRIGFVKPPKSK